MSRMKQTILIGIASSFSMSWPVYQKVVGCGYALCSANKLKLFIFTLHLEIELASFAVGSTNSKNLITYFAAKPAINYKCSSIYMYRESEIDGTNSYFAREHLKY